MTTTPYRLFVPGRLEILGKHTDYAGGASITCATRRGFRVSAEPLPAAARGIVVESGSARLQLPLTADVHAEGWGNYVATVLRRVLRNAGDAVVPARIVFESDLPRAAGMSSSSALMIATFLGLDAASQGRIGASVADAVHGLPGLAEYLACVENGASYGRLDGERGVGTTGGSQDHTAILCSRDGMLRRFSYAPYAEEGTWPLPDDLVFVVAASGVLAEKTGSAREAYNRAARLAAAATRSWSRLTGMPARHLADVVAVDGSAADTLAGGGTSAEGFTPAELAGRMRAFVHEMAAVDAAARALAGGDLEAFSEATASSQAGAERLLGNQVPETVHLAASAIPLGAIAASAFGAGFGGAVWALVPTFEADSFTTAWQADYASAWPAASVRASFHVETPGPGATRLDGPVIWPH